MMTQQTFQNGIVLYYQSNFYTVKVGTDEYQCFLKGILKKEGIDILAGDTVLLDNLDTQNLSGRIVQVLERQTQLSRPKVANITKALIIASIKSPLLSLEQLDRYLTHIQLANVTPMICISKIDLAESPAEILKIRNIYEALGVSVFTTSIRDSSSIGTLFETLKGEIVVFAGPSGVGKSSLLNAYLPGIRLQVGAVSEKIERGQHTTRHVSLIAMDEQTYIADTPGFSFLKFNTVSPVELAQVFPDFTPYQEDCHFDNCLHLQEEGCAVLANRDKIAPTRYQSYMAFQEEAKGYEGTLLAAAQKKESGYKTLQKSNKGSIRILKLNEKQREGSRRTKKQQIADWSEEDES
jgi:ribosome biogenesis GTPase / thiamine phosphate phosphatase